MSPSGELIDRFGPELRGFGASLPDEFGIACAALEDALSAEQLDQWASQGVALAHHSLRSWEAAAEYFRASPDLAARIDFDSLIEWGETASELASRSALMSAAFLKATPAVLDQLPSEDLTPWANLGERLCRGNWKSIALVAVLHDEPGAAEGAHDERPRRVRGRDRRAD